MEVFLIYPVFLIISVAVVELARQKGYSGRWWFLISLALPIISIFILLLMKKKPRKVKVYPRLESVEIPDKVLYRKV